MYQHSHRKKEGLFAPLLTNPVATEGGAMRSPSQNLGHPSSSGASTMAGGGPAGQAIRRPSPVRQFAVASAGGAPPRLKNPATIAPGQPAPSSRQRDKFVPLPSFQASPDELDPTDAAGGHAMAPPPNLSDRQQQYMQTNLGIFEDLPLPPPPIEDTSRRGRITLYCIAETFDRKKLDELLRMTYSRDSIMSYPDCFYVDYLKPSNSDEPGGDIFFFDYGVVACWGMTKNQERTVVRGIARQVQEKPLKENEIEIDEFQFNFSVTEKPHVQNDTVTLSKKFVQDHEMKLAITYALAQSTKLSMYERRVVDIVLESKNLPESLADKGEVDISSIEIAKLIGKVFLQKSAVNLLSSVLDTPEFFWHAPDNFQTLYTRVIEYVELGARVELLNSRFSVLQEMLDMLRDHENNHHSVRLEWIVIWLIVVEVVVGVFELLGLFGLAGSEHHGR